jgi:hypothetical protein
MTAPTPLERRYGQASRGPARRLTTILAVVLGALLLAGLGWVGWRHAHPPVTADLTGYDVIDASSVRVQFTLRKDSDRAARCVVRAVDRGQVAVGRAVVTIPAGVRERDVSVLVTTRRLAAAGEVTSCTLLP